MRQLILPLALLLTGQAANQEDVVLAPAGAGHGTAKFGLSYYDNGDSGDGNPFLDEALTVVEPVLYVDYNLTDQTALWSKLQYDYVSSASIERLSNYPQQSGASRDNYIGVDIGVRHAIDDSHRIGGFLTGSGEYDYSSLGLGGDYAFDFNQKNSTVKVGANAYFDTLDIIRFNGTEEGTDDRLSLATNLTWYQVLSPRMHGELGLTVSHQDGFLGTPYNAVVIEDPTQPPNLALDNNARGIEITEMLPDTRFRAALFGRVRRALNDNWSAELGGRLYNDDWGITGITLEPRAYTWLVRDTLRARFRYRYYTQTEADDFADHFTTTTKFRTQDSDLADFDSHTVGVRLDWFASPTTSFDIGFDFVKRSDGLDQMLGAVGLTWNF